MNAIRSTLSTSGFLVALAFAAGVLGGDLGPVSAGTREAAQENTRLDLYQGERPIMRYRSDPARGRLWILTEDGVDLYAMPQRRKLARFEIPGWHWVRAPYACAPDLALGPKGELVITSNVIPTVWRIDPDARAISRPDLTVDPQTDRDLGFSAFAYSDKHGAYFGVSALDGSRWKIDPMLRQARIVSPGALLSSACEPGRSS